MRVLEGLQPAAALGFFETLCAIPHGSRDTKAISDYCVRFAQERGLRWQQDASNNVIIRKPVVEAIHAGLECGIFSDRLPGLDAVSFGPQMHDIHTSRERLDIASTARTWEYLVAVLERL